VGLVVGDDLRRLQRTRLALALTWVLEHHGVSGGGLLPLAVGLLLAESVGARRAPALGASGPLRRLRSGSGVRPMRVDTAAPRSVETIRGLMPRQSDFICYDGSDEADRAIEVAATLFARTARSFWRRRC